MRLFSFSVAGREPVHWHWPEDAQHQASVQRQRFLDFHHSLELIRDSGRNFNQSTIWVQAQVLPEIDDEDMTLGIALMTPFVHRPQTMRIPLGNTSTFWICVIIISRGARYTCDFHYLFLKNLDQIKCRMVMDAYIAKINK